MKRLLSLSLFFAATSLTAQSFEWDTPAPAAHPKEVHLTPQASPESNKKEDGLAGIYAPEADGSPTAYGEIYRANEMTGSHPVLPLGTLLRVTNMENGRSVVVRITDRGRECDECVVTLSNRAARQLGMEQTSEVSVQRNGFSNWNPAPVQETQEVVASNRPVAGNVIAPAPTPAETEPSVFTREVVTSPAPAPAIAEAPKGEPTAYQNVVTPPAPTVAGAQQARGVDAEVVVENYTVQLAAYNNETYAVRRVQELKEQGLDGAYYRTMAKENGEVINRVFSGTYSDIAAAQEAARKIEANYNLTGIVSKL